MNDDLEQLLISLRLKKTTEILDEQMAKAEEEGLPFGQLLARLLRAEWHYRQESAISYRIKKAKIPEKWSIESFPWKMQPGVSKRQIRTFAELDFIPKAENIVFIGDTGVGKTGLACGLLLKALENGYRGIFVRAQDLFDDMYASLADRSTRKLLNSLARIPVLVVDELGYLNIRPEQANTFFKLMEERYMRFPTIITTNLDYSEWSNFLGNKPLVDALLSRLRHHCHTVKIEGPSLRDPKTPKGRTKSCDRTESQVKTSRTTRTRA